MPIENMKRYKIVFALGAFIIVAIGLYNIKYLHQIVIIDDELGYWGIAAKIAGVDWSSSVKGISYYSYGYSFFLAPIFRLIKNPEFRYQIAICLNIFFLLGTYCCVGKTIEKLFPDISRNIVWVIALTAILYPNNVLQVNVAWTECLQTFLISFIFMLLIYVQSDSRYETIILLFISIIFAYIVHQRNIGILFVGIIYLLYLLFTKRIKLGQTCMLMIIIGIMFIGHALFKEYLQNELWYNSTTIAVGDYSGQGDKIKTLLGFKGIKLLLLGICGRLFYLSVSTYTFFLVGLGYFLKQFWNELKNNFINRRINWTSSSWILGMFLANFVVAVIFMIIPFNISSVMYGRYIETFVPIILGVALSVIAQKLNKKAGIKKFIFQISICILITLVWGLLINNYIEKQKLTEVNFIVVSGIYKYCTTEIFDVFRCIVVTSFIVIVITVLCVLANKYKIFWQFILLFIAILFLDTAKVPINTRILEFQKKIDNNMEILKNMDLEDNLAKLYYLIPEEEDYQSTKYRAYLQYWLGEKMVCITRDEIDKIRQGDYLVMSYKAPFYQNIDRKYDLIYTYGAYVLYKYNNEKNASGYVMDGRLFDTQNQDITGPIVIYGNSEHNKAFSGYWKLEEGRYILTSHGDIRYTGEEPVCLYCIVQDMSGNVYLEKNVMANELSNENEDIILDFQLPQQEDIAIQFFAIGEGTQYVLYNVELQKM